MLKIAIILGSTRPSRAGAIVAEWVNGIAILAELRVATVRTQLTLNSYTDFENF